MPELCLNSKDACQRCAVSLLSTCTSYTAAGDNESNALLREINKQRQVKRRYSSASLADIMTFQLHVAAAWSTGFTALVFYNNILPTLQR